MKKQLGQLFTVGATAAIGWSSSALAIIEGQAVAVPEPEAALLLLPAAAFLVLKERQRRANARKRDQ